VLSKSAAIWRLIQPKETPGLKLQSASTFEPARVPCSGEQLFFARIPRVPCFLSFTTL